MRRVFHAFNYREIATPAFEELELFLAKSGPEIRDEIYEFKDKSGRDLCLRPELTAPVMRLYFSEMKVEPKPLKLFYFGPCYRYDRPQAGRYREFWQMGCELVGDDSPEAHAELLHLAVQIFEEAGLEHYVLRVGHLDILRSLLAGLGFSGEDQGALMRLIDKKDLAGLRAALQAKVEPRAIENFFKVFEYSTFDQLKLLPGTPQTEAAFAHLRRIWDLLAGFRVDIKRVRLDPTIARGLAYYRGLVFELDAPDLGAEKQLLGGGSYDLSGVFGEPPVAAAGFALGFDRTLVALGKSDSFRPSLEPVDAVVAALSPGGIPAAQGLGNALRECDLRVELDLSAKGAKKSLGRASTLGARVAVLVGDQEVARGQATLKNLATGEQVQVTFPGVPGHLEAWLRAPPA